MNKNKFGKNSFTLSETLITIVILGIIAVVVVPSIINNYQKRLTIAKLKKAYSQLETIAVNVAANTGCIGKDLTCTGLLDKTYRAKLNRNLFELGGVKYTETVVGIKKYKSMNYDALSNRGYSPITQAERNISFAIVTENKIGYAASVGSLSSGGKGIFIGVFTNPDFKLKDGIATEIKEGYNAFSFVIYDNFIVEPVTGCIGGAKYPLSKNSDANSGCNKNGTTNCYGNSCAAKIIKDGWKITYY